jgi:hypothetical protein
MQVSIDALAKTLMKQVTDVVKAVAPRHDVKDADALAQDILVGLGLVELKVSTKKTKSVKSESEGGSEGDSKRKRVVSKKMKDAYLAMEGATEENLKDTIKAYKAAEEVESFEAFARSRLGAAPEEKPAEEEKKPRKKAEKKPKAEKSGRFDKWTPTSKKLFKTIVEESGGVVNEDIQKELTTYIEGLSDEDFAAASIQGHMRAFVTTKFAPAKEETEEALFGKEEEDEDMEEFVFEEETLLIGVTSGKIYQESVGAGDILVGIAGKGRFKNVKKPA